MRRGILCRQTCRIPGREDTLTAVVQLRPRRQHRAFVLAQLRMTLQPLGVIRRDRQRVWVKLHGNRIGFIHVLQATGIIVSQRVTRLVHSAHGVHSIIKHPETVRAGHISPHQVCVTVKRIHDGRHRRVGIAAGVRGKLFHIHVYRIQRRRIPGTGSGHTRWDGESRDLVMY